MWNDRISQPDVGVSRMESSNAVHVARGASYIAIQNLTANAAMVVSFAILARLITTKDMGILAVLNLVNGLCQTVATLALQQAATRFVAEHLERNEKEAAASVFYQAIRATLLLAAPFALAVFFGATEFSILLLGEQTYTTFFQLLALDIILYAGALPVLTSTMLGLQRFKETAVIGTVNALLRQFLIIVAIVLLNDFVGLVIAWVVSDLIAASVYGWYISRALGVPRFDFPLRKLLSFSWPLSISNTVAFASSWFDRALLVIFVPLATLGVYNATITAFGVLASITTSVSTTLFPAYSVIQSSDESRLSLTGAVRMSSRYVSIIAVPIAFGLLATAKPALALFVGPAYVNGTEPLMILSGAFALTIVGGAILSPVLLALGETPAVSVITSVSVVLGLLAASILLPFLGMTGAAVARGFSMILTTVLMFVFLARKIRLELDLEAIWKSLVAGTIMAVIILAAQIPIYSKFLLPLYAVIGVLTYLALLRLLNTIKPSDMEFLRRYSGQRFGLVLRFLDRYLVTKGINDRARNSP